jgi:predicted HNH restriction endonuclease
VDKNRKNNKIKNLIWLCRNCHFLIHNYPVKLK